MGKITKHEEGSSSNIEGKEKGHNKSSKNSIIGEGCSGDRSRTIQKDIVYYDGGAVHKFLLSFN